MGTVVWDKTNAYAWEIDSDGYGLVKLVSQDIEIGGVEIKDGASDTRAKVKTDGTDNALAVYANSLDVRALASGTDSVSAVQSGTWNVGTVTTVTGITNTVTVSATDLDVRDIAYTQDSIAVYGSQNTVLQQKVTTNDLIVTLDGESVGVTGTFWQVTQPVSATDLDIRSLTSVSDSVSAAQSGTWNITNVSGTVSLPTGAATELTLYGIKGQTDLLGFVNTDQLKISVYDSGGDESGTASNPFIVRTDSCALDEDNYVSEYLTNGGSEDMAVNGGTPVEFSYTVPADTIVYVTRSFVAIEDGSVAFNPAHFAALGAALGNGVEVSITPNGGSKVVLELWKTNRQVRDTMFDFDQEFKSDGAYIGRWTFGKDLGNFTNDKPGIELNAGDKFSVIVQDDLTDLDWMSFKIKGRSCSA